MIEDDTLVYGTNHPASESAISQVNLAIGNGVTGKVPTLLNGIEANGQNRRNVGGNGSGGDDDALSSLLLLLKSNQSKQERAQHEQALLQKVHKDGDNIDQNILIPDVNISDNVIEGNSMSLQGGHQPMNNRVSNIYHLCTMDELRKYFHLPIAEVARQLGICTTLLKKICRKNQIKRWPYRQIRSITKSIQSLEVAAMNETLLEKERRRYKDQIMLLHNTLNLIIQDPNASVCPNILELFEQHGIGGGTRSKKDGVDDDNLDGEDDQALDRLLNGDTGVLLDHDNSTVPRLMPTVPSHDVAAVIAAAVATANIEVSNESSIRKRKAALMAEAIAEEEERVARAKANLFAVEEVVPLSDVTGGVSSLSKPAVPASGTFGLTLVNYMLVTECGHRKLQFRSPVHLAPLVRKKVRAAKKLVPLIEPDICNCMRMDFLCTALLHGTSYGAILPSEFTPEESTTKLTELSAEFGSDTLYANGTQFQGALIDHESLNVNNFEDIGDRLGSFNQNPR